MQIRKREGYTRGGGRVLIIREKTFMKFMELGKKGLAGIWHTGYKYEQDVAEYRSHS